MSFTIKSNKGLPKTGQTVSYQTGDDGTYQSGYPITGTGPRWVDNGDGTITDTMARLMYIKNPELIIPSNSAVVPIVPTWGSGVVYAVGDVIYLNQDVSAWFSGGNSFPFNGSYSRYRCITAHTSGTFQTDYGNGDWVFESLGNSTNQAHCARGSWAQATCGGDPIVYKAGDVVSASIGMTSYNWVALLDNTTQVGACYSPGNIYSLNDKIAYYASSCSDPLVGSIWARTSVCAGSPSKNATTYADATSYNANDVVSYMGTYFLCLNGHTSNGGSPTIDEGNNPFSWKNIGSSSTYVFQVDLLVNSTWWTKVASGPNFSDQHIDYPNNWALDPWVASACAPITSMCSAYWTTLITQCNNLEYAGYSDWRMPNLDEMMSILDLGRVPGSGNIPPIPNVFNNIGGACGQSYWTSTTVPACSSSAYYAIIGGGCGISINTATKTMSNYNVIPVRTIS